MARRSVESWFTSPWRRYQPHAESACDGVFVADVPSLSRGPNKVGLAAVFMLMASAETVVHEHPGLAEERLSQIAKGHILGVQ